jgi:hypothetical protein
MKRCIKEGLEILARDRPCGFLDISQKICIAVFTHSQYFLQCFARYGRFLSLESRQG